MATAELRDELIAESFKATKLDPESLLDLIVRMRNCLDEGVILSISEVAEMIGVSEKSVYLYYTYHDLPSLKILGHRKFYEHEVHEWLKEKHRIRFFRKKGEEVVQCPQLCSP
jgi:excisionase family DNA binding protein